MKIKNINDIKNQLAEKKVLVRVDFNVPIINGQVQDETRIKETLPTIKLLQELNCKIILLSHLGRPDGKKVDDLSLKIIIPTLEKLIGTQVHFAENCIGQEAVIGSAALKNGEILLLENCRFHPEEETNNQEFAEKLATLADFYINDAFAVSHRAHASVEALAKLLPSAAGLLLEKEVNILSKILEKSEQPLTLVLGGAKIDTKIGLFKNFIPKANYFLVGGALANTFLLAEGFNIGSSLVEKDKVGTAQEIALEIESEKKFLRIPEDVVVADEITENANTADLPVEDIEGEMKILDIGVKTAEKFSKYISESKTIIWNGPLGLAELKNFQQGTKTVGEAIAKATKNGVTTVIGGGDTIDAIKRVGLKPEQFTHVSTGGGAMLEFLEGKTLPGIAVLEV